MLQRKQCSSAWNFMAGAYFCTVPAGSGTLDMVVVLEVVLMGGVVYWKTFKEGCLDQL